MRKADLLAREPSQHLNSQRPVVPSGLHSTACLESTRGREQRKLAAILAAVVGYSRLMGRNESGMLARLLKAMLNGLILGS